MKFKLTETYYWQFALSHQINITISRYRLCFLRAQRLKLDYTASEALLTGSASSFHQRNCVRDSSQISNQMELVGDKTNVTTLSHASENPLSKRYRNPCSPYIFWMHISQRINKQRLDAVPALLLTGCSRFALNISMHEKSAGTVTCNDSGKIVSKSWMDHVLS